MGHLNKNVLSVEHRYHSEQLRDVRSEVLDRDTVIELFLPFHFKEAEQPYPLLILNDGQDVKALGLKESLDNLSQEKKICDVVVVAIHAGDRMQEYGVAGHLDYRNRGLKAKAYARFIREELIPFLHHRYPISEERKHHAIAGLSLGGLSALDIAWHHSEYFGKIGAFSGSFWYRKVDTKSADYSDDRDRIIHQVVRRGRKKEGLRFWFQTGALDEQADRNKNGVIDSIDDTLDLIVELTKKGYRPFHDIQYLEMPQGRHDLPTWKRALPEFLQWAFPVHGPTQKRGTGKR